MRIFVTGASGHIGSAVVPELLAAGHQIVALARSDASAAALAASGVDVHRGDLDDPEDLGKAAASADGVIHLAFKHDTMWAGDHVGAAEADLRVIEAFGDALAGTGKPLVTTSGTLMLALAGLGRTGTETDVPDSGIRVPAENATIALAERGVRSSVLRLPPSVHSSLDTTGFVPTLIATARARGVAAYVGDGSNRWPAVHTLDAARLYRLALEAAPAGSRLHAAGDHGVPFREIAEVIGRHLDLPVTGIPPEEADAHFGFLGAFVQLDNPLSSTLTEKLLDWQPIHPGLIADLEEGHYFTAPATP
ncbi:SDR family oxidoreductase [Streptomyces sp. B1866]|uniref:SDR family oxidoreductase n=1 Tax=Streptomyces sp. B1866 TaxID=3075431 RepID=UPI00288E14C2|nr:SDR family oxidoreductase [Streptomyces sp. B1866]MDT3396210.1 SDR family oxidoreductase [Streptomyces sp. B1866]